VSQDVLWTIVRKIGTFKGRIRARQLDLPDHRERRVREAPQPAREGRGLLGGAVAGLRSEWPPGRAGARLDQQVEDPALQAEGAAAARDAIESLPADYRTAFVLHDMEGLSNPEIAEMLEISLPAVKSRVHRSRLFLRQRLEQYFRRG
jgi:RNA polymerase sigma-70 factor (ECF subfamily)